VTGKVLTLERALEDCLPYLFHLLGGEEPVSTLAQMDPQIRRLRTFDAIRRLLVRASEDQPVELIIEDLQWLDSETEAFLDYLCESVADTRILLLVNFRPEYRHDWGGRSHYTQLRLDPLGEDDARDLLQAVLGDAPGLASLKQLILEKTEGNPFFIEEVVQTLLEEEVLRGVCGHYALEQSPTTLHIPATVQAVLAARIDRLGPAGKALLQTLAVVGKVFPWSLLARVADQPEGELKSQLDRLQDSEFIYEQPTFPEVVYSFKHALTQEVAYGSLLSERRRSLHERAAHAIEALFGARLDEHYSELAHHFSRSGNTQKAVEYLGCAGRQALQRSADSEAVAHLGTALAMLETLPDTQERARQELELRVTIGPALMASRGLAAPELEANYTRALALSRQLGVTSFPSLLGLRTFYVVSGALRTARELGEQLVVLARNAQDPALLAQAHRALGAALFSLGELGPARVQLEQALALYEPRQHYPVAFYSGLEPGVLGQAYLALDLWLLGYPDQALARSQDALALAQTLSSPAVMAPALTFAAELYLQRREAQRARELAESVVALATELGFPHWISYGTILSGWALADEGRTAEGIERIKEGLAAYGATGAELWRPHFLSLLAEAYGRAGQAEAGLGVVDEALAVVDRTEERVYEADLHRLKGDLALMMPDHMVEKIGGQGAAEASFLKAAAIARQQDARLLELRAVTGLGRLWRERGKSSDTRQTLAAIYGWFAEGFDTVPLQEAKALLDEIR
jgi:predicted ATPase